MAITWSILDRFAQFFHCCKKEHQIFNKPHISVLLTTPWVCCGAGKDNLPRYIITFISIIRTTAITWGWRLISPLVRGRTTTVAVAHWQFLALRYGTTHWGMGTTCRLTSLLRRHSRSSDSASRHFCFRALTGLTLSFNPQSALVFYTCVDLAITSLFKPR